jgi:hypothetical protein
MKSPIEAIRVPGLTRLDKLELEKELAPGSVTFKDELSDAAHGEPLTTAVVIVSVVAIRALAGWLMKDNESGVIEKKVETIDAKGKRRITTLKVNTKSSRAPKAEVVGKLAQLVGIDASLVQGIN